jgi:hypothetical protein
MFGIDWSDPQTYWLNLTNLFLGIVTVLAFAGVAYSVVRELVTRRLAAHAKQEDTHAFFDPELGFTMADGGEPEKKDKK